MRDVSKLRAKERGARDFTLLPLLDMELDLNQRPSDTTGLLLFPYSSYPYSSHEGMTGIELASSVWKTEALPLSYIPIY